MRQIKMLLNQKLSLCFENWSQRKGFGDREKGCSSQDSMLHVQIPNRILWILNPLKKYFISSELISKVNGNEFPNKFILGNIFFCIENIKIICHLTQANGMFFVVKPH